MTTDSACIWTPETVASPFPLYSQLELSLSLYQNRWSKFTFLAHFIKDSEPLHQTHITSSHTQLHVAIHVFLFMKHMSSVPAHSSFVCCVLYPPPKTLLNTTDVNTNTHQHYTDCSSHLFQMVYQGKETRRVSWEQKGVFK